MGEEERWVGGQKFLRDRKHHMGRGKSLCRKFVKAKVQQCKRFGKCKDVMSRALTELPAYFWCESKSGRYSISP